MDYIILIGVVAVLALSGLYGYKRGFIKIVLSMVAMVVTFILAAVLTVPVSSVIKSVTPIYDTIESSVRETVNENAIDLTSMDKLGLPTQLEEKIIEGASETVDNVTDYIVTSISDMLLKALTFIILIIVIYIIVRIVIAILDLISKLPIINGINKSGGLVIGLVQGLLLIWIACLVVTAFGDTEWAKEVFAQINANQLLTFIYNNNPIIYAVTKFM